MVLYHAYHAGTLANVLVHKLIANKDEKSYLLVGNEQLMGPIYKRLKDLKKLGIFEDVLYCNECYGLNEPDVKTCEDKINNYFSDIFQKAGLSISDFSSVYTGVDTLHSFAIYLSLNNCKYNFLESYQNFFKDADNRIKGIKERHPVYYETMLKHGAAGGTTPLCTRLIRTNSEKIENSEIFDFETEIFNLDEDSKSKILKFYQTPKKIKQNGSAFDVLVTCSQWVIRDLPDVKQKTITMYQYIADYFAKSTKNLVIKPHPLSRCSTEEYFQNFNGNYVFEKEFPSNFLPLLKDFSVKNTYTIGSMGARLSSGQSGVAVNANYSFYQMHPLIHKTVYLLALYQNFFKYQFNTYGISNEFVETLIQKVVENDKIQMHWLDVRSVENKFSIVDYMDWNKGNYKQTLIETLKQNNFSYILACLNSRNDVFFEELLFDFNVNQKLIIVELTKKPLKRKIVAPFESEYIYLFVGNEEDKKIIKKTQYKNSLYYTGYEIEARTLSMDDQIKHIEQLKQSIIYKKLNDLDKK